MKGKSCQKKKKTRGGKLRAQTTYLAYDSHRTALASLVTRIQQEKKECKLAHLRPCR